MCARIGDQVLTRFVHHQITPDKDVSFYFWINDKTIVKPAFHIQAFYNS